ncbi:MAG: hypothetical protein H0T62_05470 [Parachlamydiaceae bacterium]|nr:hypothetical protein [Parachlamydiaceae bacterium]
MESEKLKNNLLESKIKELARSNKIKTKEISILNSRLTENTKNFEAQTNSLKRDLSHANIETAKNQEEIKKIKRSHSIEITQRDELILNINNSLEQASTDVSAVYNVAMTNLKSSCKSTGYNNNLIKK